MTAPTLPARPMLAEVLAALTDTDADLWGACRSVAADGAVVGTLGNTNVPCIVRWTTTDPTDAAELLVTRGVLPEGWHGDTRRGWYCASCGGRGAVTYQGEGGLEDDACGVCAVDDPDATGGVRLTGYTVAPASIPDLVAVASLGWTAIQRAEELARAACRALREYGCPTPERVVWRVGSFRRYDTVWSRDVRKAETMVLVRDGRFDVPDGFGRIMRHIILPAEALWTSGLALDAITADAVRIVVPPVGGVR